MPELPTVEGFVKQLRKYTKVASCPEEFTCLLSVYCPPRENKDGEEFKGGCRAGAPGLGAGVRPVCQAAHPLCPAVRQRC
jgi:hypothetical protein